MKNGLVPVLRHQLDDARRRRPVGRHAGGLGGRAPGQGQSARPPERREHVGARHAVLGTLRPGVVALPGQVDPGQVSRQVKAHCRLSREGEVRRVPGHDMLVAVVSDLADPCREVALVVEVLGQQPQIVSDPLTGRRSVVVDARRGRAQSAEDRYPRRAAERVLHVGAVETHALGGEAIQVGGLHPGVMRSRRRLEVRAEGDVQVVRHDEQDVGTLGQARFPHRRRGGQQESVGLVRGFSHAGHAEQGGEKRECGVEVS